MLHFDSFIEKIDKLKKTDIPKGYIEVNKENASTYTEKESTSKNTKH